LEGAKRFAPGTRPYEKRRPGAQSFAGSQTTRADQIAEEAEKRKLASNVGRETTRILLLSHEFKPWREKMWSVPEVN
jgi:hypothetical protein